MTKTIPGISGRLVYSILEYGQRSGIRPEELLEGLGVSQDNLQDPRKWFPADLFLSLAQRLRTHTGNPEVMFEVGKCSVRIAPTFGRLEQAVSALIRLGRFDTVYRRVPQLASLFSRMSRFRVVESHPGEILIERKVIFPHFLHRDSCLCTQGMLAAIPRIGQGKDADIREEQCAVPVDCLIPSNGKTYVIRGNRVFECFQPEGSEREIGSLKPDGTFSLGGVTFGAESCRYRVTWLVREGIARRAFHYLSRFPRRRKSEMIQELEKSSLLLEGSFQDLDQTAQELLASKSELERSLSEVKYLKASLESILENVNASIIVVGKDGKIESVNRETERTTRYTREELIGKGIIDFINVFVQPRDQEPFMEFLRGLGEGKVRDSFEIPFKTKDGEVRYGLFNTAVIGNEDIDIDEGFPNVIVLGMDITRLKSLEQQVIQSEKLAALGSLTAGIAHELNSPLTTITADAESLAPQVEEGQKEKVSRILEAVERIRVLARDLTAYARFDPEVREWVDLNNLIKQALIILHYEVRKGNFTLELSLSDEDLRVFGNASNLEQVVINLILNAIHAMRERRGFIRVYTSLLPDGKIQLRVDDEGMGIPPEDLGRIFDPFFSTKDGGTGLGLSNVLRIVDEYQGQIRVQSTPGSGSSFQILFPGKKDTGRHN